MSFGASVEQVVFVMVGLPCIAVFFELLGMVETARPGRPAIMIATERTCRTTNNVLFTFKMRVEYIAHSSSSRTFRVTGNGGHRKSWSAHHNDSNGEDIRNNEQRMFTFKMRVEYIAHSSSSFPATSLTCGNSPLIRPPLHLPVWPREEK